MNQEEFIRRIRRVVEEPVVPGCIESYKRPPGRQPPEDLLEMSRWYNSLSDEDQRMVERVMRDAVQSCVFSLLCVLDGVSAFEEPGESGGLELYYVEGSSRELLNDTEKEDLHDIYTSEA